MIKFIKEFILNVRWNRLNDMYKTVAQCEPDARIRTNYLKSIEKDMAAIENKLGKSSDEMQIDRIIN